jgi:hypothetical protein
MPDQQPTAQDAQASSGAEQRTAPDRQAQAAGQPTASSAQPAPAATDAPHAGMLHARKPMDPTGIAAFVPPTVAVAIACTAYIWLGLGHSAGSWTIAPALITLVVGVTIVAGYMELLTGAPPSMEEQFDEHTLSEDDVHVHGLTSHDLPLDNPSRPGLLSRRPANGAGQTPAAATTRAGSDLSRGASS